MSDLLRAVFISAVASLIWWALDTVALEAFGAEHHFTRFTLFAFGITTALTAFQVRRHV